MKKIVNRLFLLVWLLFFISCASVPKEDKVPQDMEVIDMIQRAQEAFEANNYRGAKKWYEIILYRFGNVPHVRAEAEYEIAHILTKKRKWKDAYLLLRAIIEKYESRDGMRLPPEFYKLAKMDYEKVIKHISIKYIQNIEEKEKLRNEEGVSSPLSIIEDENDIRLETLEDDTVIKDEAVEL